MADSADSGIDKRRVLEEVAAASAPSVPPMRVELSSPAPAAPLPAVPRSVAPAKPLVHDAIEPPPPPAASRPGPRPLAAVIMSMAGLVWIVAGAASGKVVAWAAGGLFLGLAILALVRKKP